MPSANDGLSTTRTGRSCENRPHAGGLVPDDDDGAGEPRPEGGVDDALDHRLARDGKDDLGPAHARAHPRGEDDAEDPRVALYGGPWRRGRSRRHATSPGPRIQLVVQAAGDDPVGARDRVGAAAGRAPPAALLRLRPPALSGRRPRPCSAGRRRGRPASARVPGRSGAPRPRRRAAASRRLPRRRRGAEAAARRGARAPRRAAGRGRPARRPRRRSWSRTAAGARPLRTP